MSQQGGKGFVVCRNSCSRHDGCHDASLGISRDKSEQEAILFNDAFVQSITEEQVFASLVKARAWVITRPLP